MTCCSTTTLTFLFAKLSACFVFRGFMVEQLQGRRSGRLDGTADCDRVSEWPAQGNQVPKRGGSAGKQIHCDGEEAQIGIAFSDRTSKQPLNGPLSMAQRPEASR